MRDVPRFAIAYSAIFDCLRYAIGLKLNGRSGRVRHSHVVRSSLSTLCCALSNVLCAYPLQLRRSNTAAALGRWELMMAIRENSKNVLQQEGKMSPRRTCLNDGGDNDRFWTTTSSLLVYTPQRCMVLCSCVISVPLFGEIYPPAFATRKCRMAYF